MNEITQPGGIDIDKSEVKASLKTFVAVIASTITIVASVFACTNNINSSIVKLQVSFEKQNEMNDYKYQTFDNRLGRDEGDIKDIRTKQENLTALYKGN